MQLRQASAASNTAGEMAGAAVKLGRGIRVTAAAAVAAVQPDLMAMAPQAGMAPRRRGRMAPEAGAVRTAVVRVSMGRPVSRAGQGAPADSGMLAV